MKHPHAPTLRAPLQDLYHLVAGALLLMLCSGCASGGDSNVRDTGIAGEQTLSGVFVDERGAAVSGLSVRVAANNKEGQTSADGTVSILTDTLLSGGLDMVIGAPWGPTTITLYGVEQKSQSVSFRVVLDRSHKTAAITSLGVTPLSSVSIADAPTCLSCHQQKGDGDCSSQRWVGIHGQVFTCKTGVGGATVNTNCETCHADRGSSQCGDSAWRAVHANYTCSNSLSAQNPGAWSCSSCHEDKGHAKCGDSTWENNHRFVSCENGSGTRGTSCDSCHALKTTPLCNSPSWHGQHAFWSCGDNSGECTSCHTYKGSPRCGDSDWTRIHETFPCSSGANVTGNLSCSSCHSAKTTTKCDEASWRSTHNFFGSGKRVGGSNNLCAGCHEDDRGSPDCSDPTFKSFHCFCG